MAIVIYELDTLIVDVDVKNKGSETAVDLTGSSVDAAVDGPGDPLGASSVSIVNAAQGLLRITFDAGAFRTRGAGDFTLQLRITRGTERQTTLEAPITVRRSIFVAGQE